MNMREQSEKEELQLMCELAEGRRSGEEEGWIAAEDVRRHFTERADASESCAFTDS